MLHRHTDPELTELRANTLFAGCRDSDLHHIQRNSTESAVPEGFALCREGVLGRESFVILDGEAVVSIGGREMARLGPGSIVGEMALLDGGERTATVTAATPMRVLVLTGPELEEILSTVPTVARRVLKSYRPHEGYWPTEYYPTKRAAARAKYQPLFDADPELAKYADGIAKYMAMQGA